MPVANLPLSLSTLADNGVRTEGVTGVNYDGNVVALNNVEALDGTARNVASRRPNSRLDLSRGSRQRFELSADLFLLRVVRVVVALDRVRQTRHRGRNVGPQRRIHAFAGERSRDTQLVRKAFERTEFPGRESVE